MDHASIYYTTCIGAVNLKEAQKGLLYTGLLKILVPLIIVLPGLIAFYYFGGAYYEDQDNIYPLLVKKVMPLWLTGFFCCRNDGGNFKYVQ
ncbi:hypothetical protein Q2T40_00780 [Winogradskyella maritima]|nr:hypothetical protein [Winogradskyella maritima]